MKITVIQTTPEMRDFNEAVQNLDNISIYQYDRETNLTRLAALAGVFGLRWSQKIITENIK